PAERCAHGRSSLPRWSTGCLAESTPASHGRAGGASSRAGDRTPVPAARAGRDAAPGGHCLKSSGRARRGGLHAALISRILNFIAPGGAVTSTVSPFFLPMIALPTGDSLESLFSAGFASAEPTIRYSTVCLASRSRRRTFEPTETTS